MINKINKYPYWLMFAFLITSTYVLYSRDYSVVNIFIAFSISLVACIFLKTVADFTLKFNAPIYFKYNQDIFYHTQWNWEWNLKKEILHLKPTCPTCQNEVFHRFDTLLSKTELLCEKCNKQIANISSSHRKFVVESVKKSIIRKLKKEDASF